MITCSRHFRGIPPCLLAHNKRITKPPLPRRRRVWPKRSTWIRQRLIPLPSGVARISHVMGHLITPTLEAPEGLNGRLVINILAVSIGGTIYFTVTLSQPVQPSWVVPNPVGHSPRI